PHDSRALTSWPRKQIGTPHGLSIARHPLRLAAIFPPHVAALMPATCRTKCDTCGQRESMNRGPHLSKLRTIIVALAAMLAAGISQARADDGLVRISFVKAGWIIGGSVGSGTMTFRGRTYRLS